MDRHDLYERCVQSPTELVPFLEALHGRSPRALREDFAGTAAVSRAWAARSLEHRAVAVDIDPAVLERGGAADRVERRCADVRSAPVTPPAVDVVFVGNFSIGELATRAELIAYLGRSRERLEPGGIFVCDTYGGESCFRLGAVERRHPGPDATILHHTWEQREADPRTARVVNALHFRVERDGLITTSIADAFVYRWRLWSVPELRDALVDAGFASIEVHGRLELESQARHSSSELDASFAACVVARNGDGHAS